MNQQLLSNFFRRFSLIKGEQVREQIGITSLLKNENGVIFYSMERKNVQTFQTVVDKLALKNEFKAILFLNKTIKTIIPTTPENTTIFELLKNMPIEANTAANLFADLLFNLIDFSVPFNPNTITKTVVFDSVELGLNERYLIGFITALDCFKACNFVFFGGYCSFVSEIILNHISNRQNYCQYEFINGELIDATSKALVGHGIFEDVLCEKNAVNTSTHNNIVKFNDSNYLSHFHGLKGFEFIELTNNKYKARYFSLLDIENIRGVMELSTEPKRYEQENINVYTVKNPDKHKDLIVEIPF